MARSSSARRKQPVSDTASSLSLPTVHDAGGPVADLHRHIEDRLRAGMAAQAIARPLPLDEAIVSTVSRSAGPVLLALAFGWTLHLFLN